MDLQQPLNKVPKKDVILIIGDWNAKVGETEVSAMVERFDLDNSVRKIHWPSQTLVFNRPNESCVHGHHQMGNIETKLIRFYATGGGKAP